MSQIFNVTHETGDLSQYTTTATDGGDLSVTAAAALAGAFGLSVLIDDTIAIYGGMSFTTLTSGVYRTRFYIDPNGLTMATNDEFLPLVITTSGGTSRALVALNWDGSAYRIRAGVRIDAGTFTYTSYYTISDGPHWIEALWQYATTADANNGVMTLWIDGVQQQTITTLDLFTLTQPGYAVLGASSGLDSGTSGTFYLDEWILRNDAVPIGRWSSLPMLPRPPRESTPLRM